MTGDGMILQKEDFYTSMLTNQKIQWDKYLDYNSNKYM